MRVLISTGCTSGLGSLALSQFLSRLISPPSSQRYLILAGHRSTPPRSLTEQAERLKDKVELKWLELDLAHFESVNRFTQNVKMELDKRGLDRVDTLLLNAAVWKAEYESVRLGEKDFSKEAMVNHFSQYYLTQELLPFLSAPREREEERSRIIFTTSSLQNSIKSLDELLPLLTSPSSTPNSTSKTRYAASKLIQTLSFHSLHHQLTSSSLSPTPTTSTSTSTSPSSSSAKEIQPIDIISVSPGFVPTTGLARETSWWQRLLMRYVISWAPFCTTQEEGAKRIVDCITLPISELESNSSQNPTSTRSKFIFQPSQDSSNNLSLNALLAQVKEDNWNEGQGMRKWEELREVWMPSLGEMRSWTNERGSE